MYTIFFISRLVINLLLFLLLLASTSTTEEIGYGEENGTSCRPSNVAIIFVGFFFVEKWIFPGEKEELPDGTKAS